MDFDRDSIERLGFQGFISVASLYSHGYVRLPSTGGVYMVLREEPAAPTF